MEFSSLLELADRVAREVAQGPVATGVAPHRIREHLAAHLDLGASRPAPEVLEEVERMLRRWSVQVTHPRYFGLFNPCVLPEAVAAAALVAAYNPQEAVWTHAPAAQELERHALRHMASLVGFDPDRTAAHFTSGGQEANLTAVLAALSAAFPRIVEDGVQALPGRPVLYLAGEGHHSIARAARVAGLGSTSVRWVGVDDDLRMDVGALCGAVARDRAEGRLPFLVVGTAGTTASGAIDPLAEIANLARAEGLWFHCDAAWGGGALLSPRLRGHLAGIERADSVTWDAHKWLSCPMGSGAFLCTRPDAVRRAFEMDSGYMPAPRDGAEDPHRVSLQWSRRAIGVPVAVAFAVRGPEGYAALVEHQAAMGDRLRDALAAADFRIVNRTALPLVCFDHPRIGEGGRDVAEIARRVVGSGRAWISPVVLGSGQRALRACITSYRTTPGDVDALVAAVVEALG